MTILVFVGSLLGAMAIGIPISFALLVCGAALMWHLDMFEAQILAQNVINGADSYPLLAVPFFLLAGELMNTGGLSRRIVNLALVLVGHIRGGLGYVCIVAACLLAAPSGSAVADAAALSTMLLPMMVAAGVLLGYQLWRTASGQLGDDELVMVQESEDLAQVQALHIGESADGKR